MTVMGQLVAVLRGHGPSSVGQWALLLLGQHAQASVDEIPLCVAGVKFTGLRRNTATPRVYSRPPEMRWGAAVTRAASDTCFSCSCDLSSSQSTDPKHHSTTHRMSGW